MKMIDNRNLWIYREYIFYLDIWILYIYIYQSKKDFIGINFELVLNYDSF